MQEESRRLLINCVDQVAQATAGRLRAISAPLLKIVGDRATSEPSADRRKRLATISAVLGKGWGEALAVYDESFRSNAAIAAGWRDDAYTGDELASTSLKLVDDDQVEWELAFAGAVMRMKAAGGDALSEVEQRVAAVLGVPVNDEYVNPLGLDVIGKGIKVAIEQLLPEVADRRALLVHFEPLFTKEVAALYGEINSSLADRGIGLPGRQRPAQRRPAGGPGSGAPGAATSPAEQNAGDFMGLVQRMAGAGAAGGGGGQGAPAGPQVPLVSGAALPEGMPMVAVPAAMVEALSRLQESDLGRLQEATVGQLVDGGGNTLRELRKQDFVRELPPVDVATIDIVAMLFDFIFEDRLVPDAIKALVGRLQIPLLKVAMVDKTFFARRDHPARLVLDTISKVSIAAGKGLDHGHPVFERVKQAVNTILTDFEKKPGIFDTLLADLSDLLADQEKAALDIADRSRHVAEAQEREDLAETWTRRAFDLALKDAGEEQLPTHIVDFLSRYWTRVLKFAYLKGGAEGHPWALAVGTLNELLWSVKPKETSEERQKLVAQLPEILRRVNAYLDRVQVDAEQKSMFMNALGDIHFTLIKGGRRPSKKSRSKDKEAGAAAPAGTAETKDAKGAVKPVAPAETKEAQAKVVSGEGAPPPSFASISSEDLAPSIVVTRSMQEGGLEVESIALAGRILSSRPVKASDIGNIERGDWVEFVKEDGDRVRGRLSWVSPQRGILLFTNPQSSQAISISPEALALQMRRGLASKLDESEALVDRALGKAMNSMAG